MTVQNTTVKDIYVGNGATTKFPITFQMTDHPEYIKVYITGDDSVAVETENFSVDLGAKTVTYPANGDPLPDGHKITIYRELPLYQLMNLVNQGPFFAENIELSFDDLTFICQQLNEKLNRTLSAGIDVSNFNNTFPVKAGMSFRINDAGDGLVLTEDPARVLPLAKDVLEQTKQVKESAVKIKDEAVAAKNTAVEAAATAAEDAVNNVQTLLDEKVAAAENAKSAAVSSAESALASKNAAAASQSSAAASAETAQASAESASSSANAALTSENNAKASETKSAKSEENAKASETAAENSKKSASDSASAASSSAESALESKTLAAASANSASASKTSAESSAESAASSATTATRQADRAQGIADSLEGLAGITGIATTEEAIAGVVDNKAMTPLKTKEAIEQGTNVFTALNAFRANLAVSNGTTAGSSGSISFGISPADETVQARISTDLYGGLFYHASTSQPHVFRNGSNLNSLVIRANDTIMSLSSGNTIFATVNYTGGIRWLGNANTATKLETARTINGVAFDGTQDITISNVAPLPTNTDGVGKWTVVSTTLPNGGMWAYFGFYTDSGGGVNGAAHYAGIAAGGTTVSSGSWRHTFCWRIS